MSGQDAADQVLRAADGLGQLKARLEELGPPPEIMAEEVRRYGLSFELLDAAARAIARGIRSNDFAALREGTVLLDEAVAIGQQALAKYEGTDWAACG